MPGRRAEELYYGLVESEAEEDAVYVDAARSGIQRSTPMAAMDHLRTEADRGSLALVVGARTIDELRAPVS